MVHGKPPKYRAKPRITLYLWELACQRRGQPSPRCSMDRHA